MQAYLDGRMEWAGAGWGRVEQQLQVGYILGGRWSNDFYISAFRLPSHKVRPLSRFNKSEK